MHRFQVEDRCKSKSHVHGSMLDPWLVHNLHQRSPLHYIVLALYLTYKHTVQIPTVQLPYLMFLWFFSGSPSNTIWSRALLQPVVFQLDKKFPTVYGAIMFITMLTRVIHLTLFWKPVQSSQYPHTHISLKSILTLSSHLLPVIQCSKKTYVSSFTSLPLDISLLSSFLSLDKTKP